MSIRHNFLDRSQADVIPQNEMITRPRARTPVLYGIGDFRILFIAHWRLLALSCMIALMVGLFYVFVAEREYSAAVKVRVDLQKTDLLPGVSAPSTFLNIDSALLEGYVDLARSTSVLRAAANGLNLDIDPDYNRSSHIAGLRRVVSGLLQREKQKITKPDEIEGTALLALADRTRIDRIGQSLLIRFTYRSSDRQRAAFVANALAKSFIEIQHQSQKQDSLKITSSLQDRLRLMRDELVSGDMAVAKYKSEHILAETPGGSELERQLADLNNQSSVTKAEAAALKVRFERLTGAANTFDVDALLQVEGANHSLSLLQFELTNALTHNDLVETARIKSSIHNVITSLVRSRRVALQFAESRANHLAVELARVKEDARRAALHHVELAELQRHAESRRVIYEATLTAFNRFVQNDALPAARFKVVEEAVPPALPHWPQAPVIIASMLLLGFSFASGLILLREGLRQTFNSSREISSVLGLLPIATPHVALPDFAGFEGFASVLSDNYRMRDAMVRLQLAIWTGSSAGLVVGVTSAGRDEGKTSITALLGASLALSGVRVLLVDLCAGGVSGGNDISQRLGIVPTHRRNENELPAFLHRVAENIHLLSEEVSSSRSNGMRSVFTEQIAGLRKSFDIVIVDLPEIDDVHALATCLDKVLLVVEWNQTKRDQTVDLLDSAPLLASKIVCAVLNKVQWRRIRYSAPQDFERLRPSRQPDKINFGGTADEI